MVERVRQWHRREWRERGHYERLELQNRIVLVAMTWFFWLSWMVLPLAQTLVWHRPLPMVLALVLLCVGAAQCVAAGRLLGKAIDQHLGRGELPRRELAPTVVLMFCALALTLALEATGAMEEGFTVFVTLFAVIPYATIRSIAAPIRTVLLEFLLLAAGVTGAFALAGVHDLRLFGFAGVVYGAGLLCLLSARCSAWGLSLMWQAEQGREAQALLAVAEERLRFGRDLHDVMGRNLAVIALKSELAVQLAQRGRPEAVDQMIEVQRIAQESQKEVREVVRGYRQAGLDAELAGAQSVLRAAGIACEVTGREAVAELTAPVQAALGWVIREAATNVLRHGDAGRCEVDVRVSEGRAVLTVVNDGAPEALSPGGSGLTGLRERLSGLEGTLQAGPEPGGRFRLTAEVPLRSRAVVGEVAR
ncbi:sensor histidine kinase [Streptomyces sp. TRM66268-LWL]|uniref:Sensor histidine kinase n=2 Tax=Streptomyces polyasparticus TaxID=2767826 RepID=A0ABR7SW47_9ACTN|nr:sensor histidine kinase [Streptomyces polyasparticus]